MTPRCPSCPSQFGRVVAVEVQDVNRAQVTVRCPKCYRVWTQTMDEPQGSRFDVPRVLPFRPVAR